MAINWLLALKAVPWADVVQAAPAIVQGARKLLSSVRKPPEAAGTAPATGSGEQRGGVVPRLSALEATMAELRAEQQDSAALIRSLAEQNAKVIEAIEVLRARQRLLLLACAVLVAAMAAMAIWIAGARA